MGSDARYSTSPPDAETQGEITAKEIKTVIASIKNRKVPGIDVITAEVLKAGGDLKVAMLHKTRCMTLR